MPNKLLLFICTILIAGGVVYAFQDPGEFGPIEPVDPWANLVTETQPNAPAEKLAEYEARAAELTTEIATKSSAGEYVLHLYFERGGHYQRLGKLRLAFEDFQIVVDGDPGNETAWNNMGDLRIAMGDVDGAEQYYLKAIETYPEEITYNKLYRYYLTYREDDRFEEIGPLLEEAIERAGPYPSLYIKLGRWYLEKGDRDSAVAAYRQAAVLDPDNEAIKVELNQALSL